MLTTLFFLVVAMKSKTFSSFSYSASEQGAGAGREHSQTASSSWPLEILHTIDVMLSSRMGVGQGAGISSSLFCEFETSLVQEFELFWEFRDFRVPQSLLRD